MQIKRLEEEYFKEYEEFLLSFDESLVYYSIKYKNLLEDFLKAESQYTIVVDDNNKIQAILPLMKKEGKYGVVLNSLPFYGSNGGILVKSNEALNKLANYYNKLSKEVASSTYITNPLKDNSEAIKYDIVDKRVGQWTNIEEKESIEDDLMKSFYPTTRTSIRKAIKSGIKVEIDNSQIDFLYETHYENMTSVGGKPKDKRFFELIDKYFEANRDYNIYIAKKDEKIISALLLFYYNNTVEYFTPAILKEYRNYQSTSLIIYKAMIEASKRGYKWWNWGGTWHTLDGVYRFKQKFGAIDKEYNLLININNKEIYKSNKEELLQEYDNFFVVPFDKLDNN